MKNTIFWDGIFSSCIFIKLGYTLKVWHKKMTLICPLLRSWLKMHGSFLRKHGSHILKIVCLAIAFVFAAVVIGVLIILPVSFFTFGSSYPQFGQFYGFYGDNVYSAFYLVYSFFPFYCRFGNYFSHCRHIYFTREENLTDS